MNPRSRFAACVLSALAPFASTANAASPELGYTITFESIAPSWGGFNVRLQNTSRDFEITHLELTMGNNSRNFDAAYSFSGPFGYTVRSPDENGGGGVRSQRIIIDFTNLAPFETARFTVDMDDNPADFRTQLFNNGNSPNAVLSITGRSTSGPARTETLNFTLPDGPAGLGRYQFSEGPTRHTLKLKSLVEAASDPANGGAPVFVNEASVRINDAPPQPGSFRFVTPSTNPLTTTRIGQEIELDVLGGDEIEITAPQVAYRDLGGSELSDSALADPSQIRDQAEERFRAIGISVNDDPQTGDPTLYEFQVTEDTDVVVKWKHEYALRIESDFASTASFETNGNGDPWATPLSSQATGNPMPEAGSVHWIERNAQVTTSVDSSYNDAFQHPGLAIRYVPYTFVAYGAANPATSRITDETARRDPLIKAALISARSGSPNSPYANAGVGLRTLNPFTVGQSPEPRHQIGSFTMYGPTEVRYLWKIQFGVEVNVDAASREDIPNVITYTTGTPDGVDRSAPGTYWFDQDTHVTVAAKSVDSAASDANGLTGWIAGDGYYFSSSGSVDAASGALLTGGPASVGGTDVATWLSSFNGGYRALDIPRLRRPAKVLWTYGSGLIRTQVTVGEHVFQNEPALARLFNTEPTVKSTPAPTNPIPQQGVWDPEAAKFYPFAGGVAGGSNTFRLEWTADGATQPIEVEVEVVWPNPAHYPNVVGAPPVALDPDPTDDWLFKELSYSESSASVDDEDLFSSPQPGRSVLLFSNIQRQGRGQPREFVQVRVVETKTLADAIVDAANPVEVVIGEKIIDRALDLAKLGTGYLVGSGADDPTKARYNPFIYEPAKLSGIAAKDVYDTDLLFSDSGQKTIANKGALPGPLIPVNLHPNVTEADLLRVVWYDDPAQNDGLLWPHAGRIYTPRWPSQGRVDISTLGDIFPGDNDGAGRPFHLAGATGIALEGQLAYVAAAADDTMSIIDVTNPSHPRLVSEANTSTGDFTHLGGAVAVAVEGGIAYVAAPNSNAVTLIDVSNPVRPLPISKLVDGDGTFDSLSGASSLAISGNLLFIGAPTDSAVTVVDVSVPELPRLLATIPGAAGVSAVEFASNVLYVASTSGMLSLFDLADPTAPALVGSLGGLTGATDLLLDNDVAFVARGASVSVVDVSDASAPTLVIDQPANASTLASDRGLLFTASSAGASLVDVGDPEHPALLRTITRNARGLAAADGVLYAVGTTGDSDFAALSVRADRIGRIVIATQWGSESEDLLGRDQLVEQPSGTFARATTYDPTRLQQVAVYNQPIRDSAGYNPNEEHALMAPSLRYAQVSPRPSAAYALRNNDLNVTTRDQSYTSDPYVLVQYFDVAEEEFKMNLYTVRKKDNNATTAAFEANYTFADLVFDSNPTPNELKDEPFVRMEAGEPVIPFYPIGFVDGAVPCPQTYGSDLLSQKTYWEDHRGSNWAISGGDRAWFATSPHYRMSPDFWWPMEADGTAKPGQLRENRAPGTNEVIVTQQTASVGVGDCVPFLPRNVSTILASPAGKVMRTVRISTTGAPPIITDDPDLSIILRPKSSTRATGRPSSLCSKAGKH